MSQNKSNESNKSIYTQWEQAWGDEKNYFVTVYKNAYNDVKKRAEKNKRLNFRWKKIFVGLLGAYSVALLVTGILIFRYQVDIDGALFPVIISALGGFGIFLAALKWLDVSRYQETWARHIWIKSMLDFEMIRFIEKMHPYATDISEDERKVEFQKRVLELLEKNIEKFVSNMESKEQRLGDGLSFPDLSSLKTTP